MLNLETTNVVDLSVIAILVLSGIFALVRGLVSELVSLTVWTGSVIVSARFFPIAKPWLSQHIKNEMGVNIAAVLVVFCATFIVLALVGKLISSLIKGDTLTAIDRSLGFVFGLVRGALVVCVVYLCLSWLWPTVDEQPEWLKKARARPFLEVGAEIIKSVVPQEELEKAVQGFNEGKEGVKKTSESIEQINKIAPLIPAPPASNDQKQPSYNNDSRGNLDRLINEKGK